MSDFETAFVNRWGNNVTNWNYNELIHRVTVYYDNNGKECKMTIENTSKEFVKWLKENC